MTELCQVFRSATIKAFCAPELVLCDRQRLPSESVAARQLQQHVMMSSCCYRSAAAARQQQKYSFYTVENEGICRKLFRLGWCPWNFCNILTSPKTRVSGENRMIVGLWSLFVKIIPRRDEQTDGRSDGQSGPYLSWPRLAELTHGKNIALVAY